MDTFINILLLVIGFIGAVAAIGGDTWHKGSEPVLKRITSRGWLSIAALSVTMALGVVKEFRSAEASQLAAEKEEELKSELSKVTGSFKGAEVARAQLQEQLSTTNQQLSLSQQSLDQANEKLERAQRSLSSIEPDILEGMFQLTERIPREQDFAFANVSGNHEVIPISSESSAPLKLYGGDVFEWHHFCSYPGDAGFRNGELDNLLGNRRRPEPFVLDTGHRQYPILDKEGQIRISGPIGRPMRAVILNPTRYKNCGFKIVVRSTDRTRTRNQFEPLLRKIREAKSALE